MESVLKCIQATVPVASASNPTLSLFKEGKAGMRKLSPEQQMPFGNHVGDAGVRARLLRMAEPFLMMSQQLFEAQGFSSLDAVPPYLRHLLDLHETGLWLLQQPLLQGGKPMDLRAVPLVRR